MRLGLNRRNVGRLVLVAWAVALAWLARRQLYRGEAAAVTAGAARLEPGGSYYAVLARGRQIGQLNISVDTMVDGVRVTEILALDLRDGDSTRQVARRADYILSRSLRLREYSLQVFGGGGPDRIDASVGDDSVLTVIAQDGATDTTGQGRFLLRADAVLPVVLPFRVALGGRFRAGARYALPVFDAATGTTKPLAIALAAESTLVVSDSAVWDTVANQWSAASLDTLRSLRLTRESGLLSGDAWIDPGGMIAAGELGPGVTLERGAYEIVRNNYRAQRRTASQLWRDSLSGALSLAATARSPSPGRDEQSYLVQFEPTAGRRLRSLEAHGGRQETRDDSIVVVHRVAPPDSASPLPEYLWQTADLPVRDTAVANTVRRVLGRARLPSREDSVRRLTLWIASQVTTIPAAGGGSALLALKERRGSADAKARLLVTMARAAGIPARVANGVAATAETARGHSWAEIWLAGWQAADPTFGQFPASTALIRISTDRRSRPLDLLPLVGSARFLPLPPEP